MARRNAARPVLMVGREDDAEMDYLVAAVQRHGGVPVRPNWRRLARGGPGAVDLARLRIGDEQLETMRVVCLRNLPMAPPFVDEKFIALVGEEAWQARYAIERERASLIMSMLRMLETPLGMRFVNPLRGVEVHLYKLHQYALLHAAGLAVAETLVTAEAETLRRFAARFPSIITKGLAGGTPTRRVTADELEKGLACQRGATLFQAELEGDEYRVYCLDGKVLAAFCIPTAGVVDARDAIAKRARCTLPRAAQQLCLGAMEVLGLRFAAVELRHKPRGRWVLLECNPTPAISFYDDPVDGAVINALARDLVGLA